MSYGISGMKGTGYDDDLHPPRVERRGDPVAARSFGSRCGHLRGAGVRSPSPGRGRYAVAWGARRLIGAYAMATGTDISPARAVWIPCGWCWGQRLIYEDRNGEGLVPSVCDTCLGVGERIVPPV